MRNNRADDITNEPHERGACKRCGEIAHYPERCYGVPPPSTICKKCGRDTGMQRVQFCDDCATPSALLKRRSRVPKAA